MLVNSLSIVIILNCFCKEFFTSFSYFKELLYLDLNSSKYGVIHKHGLTRWLRPSIEHAQDVLYLRLGQLQEYTFTVSLITVFFVFKFFFFFIRRFSLLFFGCVFLFQKEIVVVFVFLLKFRVSNDLYQFSKRGSKEKFIQF